MKRKAIYLGMALLMSAAAADHSLAQVATFDFDEGEGTTVSSGDGQLQGTLGFELDPEGIASSTEDSPSGADGDLSVFLPGSDGLSAPVEIASVTELVSNPLTMEAWVNIDEFDQQWEDIFRIGNTVKLGFHEGTIVFTTLGVLDWFSNVPVPTGEWAHIAVVWTPEQDAVFFLNGEEVFRLADARPARTAQNDNLSIGASHTLSSPMNGALDRLRLHQAALSPDDLDSDPANPKEALDSTVIFYNFDNGLPAANAVDGSGETSSQLQVGQENSVAEFSADAPTGEAGDFSVFFNGEGARVIVPDPDGLMQMDISQDFTLEAFVKFEDLPQNRSILLSYGLPGGYSFSVVQARNLFATTYGIKDFTEAGDAIVPEGWHHVALVHNFLDAQMNFFVDGELKTSVEYFDGVSAAEVPELSIGVETSGDSNSAGLPYRGYIDRIRIHDTVVAPEDFDIVDVPTAVQKWPLF